ncbi:hypothetical protein OHB41_13620 [Streptomyces sp. NBC_01571]|nr:hypothetical protein [Streptomyces sp. NBC_01571]MCX4574204.1 hypothetical protein [Streptomyces sp. NBC_01571]
MRLGRALATGVAEEQVRVDEEDLRQIAETAEPEASTREEVPVAR